MKKLKASILLLSVSAINIQPALAHIGHQASWVSHTVSHAKINVFIGLVAVGLILGLTLWAKRAPRRLRKSINQD